MSGRQVERGRGRGESFALALAFALLVPAVVPAAAPPVPPREVPGPPLFNPGNIHTDPVHMAMAVLGGTPARKSAPWVTLATVFAGEKVGSWDLDGVMTNDYNRQSFGAALLVAAGFQPGWSPIDEINLLRIGQSLDLWALQDTDKLLYFPESELRIVEDGGRTGVGGPEARVYNHFQIRAFFTSPKAFASGVRTNLTYTHLLSEPERCRGEVVRVDGRLLRVNRFTPSFEVQKAGVSDLYEAYVFNEVFGASPYCVVFTNWPEHLPRSYLGQAKIKDNVRVSADGYFFKIYKYRASDARKTEREMALVVTHTLQYDKPPGAAADPLGWVHAWMYGFMAGLGALAVGIFGVTYWYRRSDSSVRRRLMAHAPEFVLPSPDAPPPGPPMATPVRPANGIDRSAPMRPRITFPSSGKGGGRGEGHAPEEGQPPDEGAGA